MLFKKKYDLIFGIGEACACSQILRKCQLQFFSYPYDWLWGSDIVTKTKILANNYKDFINKLDLEDTGNNNADKKNLCKVYRNIKNNIVFNHDFEYKYPFEESYKKVKTKYDRRIKRQIFQIEKSNKVLVVYLQAPNNNNIINENILLEVRQILQDRFPHQDISLLYLSCDHNNKKISYKNIFENIYVSSFDYDAYNKEIPHAVNGQILQKLFCKLKISTKFMTLKNLYKRNLYLAKCLFRGIL